MNRSCEKSVSLLMVKLKHGDSRMRSEILWTMERLVNGLGSHVSEIHREISKAAKTYMSDRVMSVRSAAAKVRVRNGKRRRLISPSSFHSVSRGFDSSPSDNVHPRIRRIHRIGIPGAGRIQLRSSTFHCQLPSRPPILIARLDDQVKWNQHETSPRRRCTPLPRSRISTRQYSMFKTQWE